MTRPIALVTGASSGLGEAFARALAASGHDLVLVARTGSALEELAADLEKGHRAKAEVLVADLAAPDGVGAVETRIVKGAAVDTVVNCAGFGHYGPFVERPLGEEQGQVLVNVLALVTLSHAALRTMVPRRAGALLNVASVAGFAPTPGGATYSATKAFVLSFTEALHDEVAAAGVHVSVVCPGFTRTDFQRRAGVAASGIPAAAWSEPARVVEAALGALARNRAVCVPGIVNTVAAAAPRFGPRGLVRRISSAVMQRVEAP